GERFAFDAFHDEVVHAVLMPDIVEDADVGMIQAGDGLGLALEALLASWIGGEMSGENLDGYGALKTRVPGSIHLTHSARSKRSNNLIGSKSCTRSQSHNRPDYNPRNALQACSLVTGLSEWRPRDRVYRIQAGYPCKTQRFAVRGRSPRATT